MNTNGTVQSVDRALRIIDLLAEAPEGLGVTELANRLDVAKSTVHRLLASLLQKGYVKQGNERDVYTLGFTFMEMGERVAESIDVRKAATEVIHDLAKATASTVHLVQLEGAQVVYIDKVETYARLRLFSRVGRKAPLYCTGVGKALLAFQPPHMQERLLDEQEMVRHTPHTITSKEAMMPELDKIAQEGVAYDREEHELGVTCVAAPIFDFHRRALAAVSVTMPHMNAETIDWEKTVQQVQRAATAISRELGH